MLSIFADSFMTATRMPNPNGGSADGRFHNEQPRRIRRWRSRKEKRPLIDI